MRRLLFPAVFALAIAAPGCAWLTRGANDVEPEKLYADEPCTTECCCKTKSGYYSYFRCLDRPQCDEQEGSCERPDAARCEAQAAP